MDTKIKSGWKHELRALKYEHIKRTAPGFFEMSGGYDMKLMPYRDDTPTGLINCIIDWINFSGGEATRINNQIKVRKERINLSGGRAMDQISYSSVKINKDAPDIHAVINGRNINIKIGKDRHQDKEILPMVVNSTAKLYLISSDMQSFVSWFREVFYDGSGLVSGSIDRSLPGRSG